MPIYVYKCGCGHKFDALKDADDRNIAVCPKCGGIAQRYWGDNANPLLKFKSIHQPGRTGWDRIDNGAYYEKSKRKNRRDYEGG